MEIYYILRGNICNKHWISFMMAGNIASPMAEM